MRFLVILAIVVLGLIGPVLGDICTAASYGPPYIREYTMHLLIQIGRAHV